MLVHKNEVIHFQKSPRKALCKNRILLNKYPFFQNQILRHFFFNQAPQQHHFCTVNSILMLQKSLGYAINKFGRFYRVPVKIVQENYKFQNFSHALKQRLFYQKLILTQNFDYHSKNGKETGFQPYCLVKALLVYWTGVNIITYGKSSGVLFKFLNSVLYIKQT